MERESFVFYKSWWDAVGLLPGELRGEVLTAIIEYGLTGETNSIRGNTTKAILELIKPQIDANNIKYMNGCEGAKHGKLGGAPIGNRNASRKNNPETTPKQPRNNPETTPNVYDNVYDNVNVNENVSSSRTHAREEVTEEKKKEFFKIFFFRNISNIQAELDRFIAWNTGRGKVPTSADAVLWKPEDSSPRISQAFLSVWKQINDVAASSGEEGKVIATMMIDENLSARCLNGKYVITCNNIVKTWIHQNYNSVAHILEPFLHGCELLIKGRAKT